jgi:phage tail-like protein
MALSLRLDPHHAHTFAVEIDGLFVAGFAEVSGLSVETEVTDYHEGGLNDSIHRLPGPVVRPANIVLRRGLTDLDSLWRWHEAAVKGNVERMNGSIVLLRGPLEAWRWNFKKGIPVRWAGPDLRAGDAQVAMETLEIAHSGLTRGGSALARAASAAFAVSRGVGF